MGEFLNFERKKLGDHEVHGTANDLLVLDFNKGMPYGKSNQFEKRFIGHV